MPPVDSSSVLTFFDYAVMAILALSAVVGAWRGLVSEVVALFSWLVALAAAWFWSPLAARILAGSIVDDGWRHVAGFALIFLGVLLLAGLLRYLLRKLIRTLGLRPVDRLFGLFFGIVRGVVIVLALFLGGKLIGLAQDPSWRNSLFAPQIDAAIHTHLLPLLPPELNKHLPPDLFVPQPAASIPPSTT